MGMAAALFLGQSGITTLLLERDTAPYPFPRAVHLDDETLRILEQLGLFPELESALRPFEEAFFVDAKKRSFWHEDLRNAPRPNGFSPRNWFHQPSLEQLLEARLRATPAVDFWRGVTLENIRQEVDMVTAVTRQGETFRAFFLLGADGAKSTVRRACGIALWDRGFHQTWIVVDAEVPDAAVREQLPTAHIQYANAERPTTYVRSAQGHFRWEFMVLPDEKPEHLLQKTDALLRPYVPPESLHILRKTPYTFHALLAERWQDKRVFLLGDAAHQMPPFAGQGLCAGLRDAQNLSWKIRAALSGSDSKLLTSYEAERRPHVAHIMRGAVWLGRIIQTRNPLLARLRNPLFRAVGRFPALRKRVVAQAAGQPPLSLAGQHPKAGHLFPRFRALPHRFCQVFRDQSPETPPEEPFFVFSTGSFAPLETNGWERLRWARVRPDGYVAEAQDA